VVVAAIGWAIPLLGLSLLAFLTIDAVVGLARWRRLERTAPTAAG
jgi:hypothetical protein